MLNPNLKLNPKVWNDDVEQVPIRQGFGEGLLKAGELDEAVVGLCADLTESTKMNLFADRFPKRFIQVGVAEQNLATVASGLSAMGKMPFVSSYAMFSPGRNWEQIRTTITYNNTPVVIVGSHAGVSVGPDGGTHQALEDVALMRVLPRMNVIAPCDSIQAKKATLALAALKQPAYLRLAREKSPIITTEDTPFELGKAQVLYSPDGLTKYIEAKAAEQLQKILEPARQQQAVEQRTQQLNAFKQEHPDFDTLKPEMIKLIEGGVVSSAEDAYFLIKGRQEKAAAAEREAELEAYRRAAREAGMKVTTGTPSASAKPKFTNAYEAYLWRKNNPGR